MYKEVVDTGVHVSTVSLPNIAIPHDQHAEAYWQWVPQRWGGTLAAGHDSAATMQRAFLFCRGVVDAQMVADAVALCQQQRSEDGVCRFLGSGSESESGESEEARMKLVCDRDARAAEELLRLLPQRVLMVANDGAHAEKLQRQLHAAGMPPDAVFVVTGVAEATFKEGDCSHPNVKVVVVPKTRCEGWDGTHFTVMMRGVYFGNQASRTQMEGRIDRLSSIRKVRWIRTYSAGVHEMFLRYQLLAASLEAAMRTMQALQM